MEVKGNFNLTSFEFEQNQYPEFLTNYIEDGNLYNQENLLFLEERYIDENSQFLNISEKLSEKDFDSKLKIVKNDQLKEISSYNQEIELFRIVLSENNIEGVSKKDLLVSVNHFENYEHTDKIKFVQSIYILLFLANITVFRENQFSFKVKFDENEVVKKISFEKIEQFDLIKIYNWITTSKENLHTRLKIIREIILRKQSFNLVDSDLESAKSAFNRIIKEETDKYFIQVNMLKDDFFKLSEQKRKSYNSLHLKFLGWTSSIGIFIYGQLKDKSSGSLFHTLFFTVNEKTRLFLIIFLIALMVIWSIFMKEMWDNKKEYRNIKEFYTKQLFFEEVDFKNYLEEPKINLWYKLMLIFLILCLIIRFFV